MELIVPLNQVTALPPSAAGNKVRNLAALAREGLRVPEAVCVTTGAYEAFVSETGIDGDIRLELSRRPTESMRWEEMWDAALRIRNAFTRPPWPPELRAALEPMLASRFGNDPVVVRSSAPDEDAAQSSFAGLHESYVNVCGTDAILHHVRLVWASLWSDAAILYRRELGLDVAHSRMAVLVQRLAQGECSGVIFLESPADPAQTVIEAVHGLNQGLVDGTVQPDRWLLDRHSGCLLEHHPVERPCWVIPTAQGTATVPLPRATADRAPLREDQLAELHKLAERSAHLFGAPQDVEWTICGEHMFVLQSRDITTRGGQADSKSWYLSLRRSYDNLVALWRRIEDEILPGMAADADAMGAIDLSALDDDALADTCQRRRESVDKWHRVYRDECIPMAHGMRLFGRFYNDVLAPDDPHEFVQVLAAGQQLLGQRRNKRIQALANRLAADPALRTGVSAEGLTALPHADRDAIESFCSDFGASFEGLSGEESFQAMLSLVIRMGERGATAGRAAAAPASPRPAFLDRVPTDRRAFAEELLELGRASFRLRDDDNIYLGRVEAALRAATEEAGQRLTAAGRLPHPTAEPPELERALRDPTHVPAAPAPRPATGVPDPALSARQLVGQPAGPGVASGPAHVIRERADLFSFESGSVLVCDAIDPNMTLVVPLAAAIVERRGGMLIHGAIIAREYGIPCVTGIDAATDLIQEGMRLTVDGYLGIVRLGE